MTESERCTAARIGVMLPAIVDHPVGAIIGEAPGPNTDAALPLFPHDLATAGGRLLGYSRMDAALYLSRIARCNLFPELDRHWSVPEARSAAFGVWSWLNANDRRKVRRVVLLGNRVSLAFGIERPWRVSRGHVRGLELVGIPHPSGRCRIYNLGVFRDRAGAAVRWAAGLRESFP